ncbi:MAG: hypothetical protein LQ348_003525 [Seirophora lacunosa]|nr:MAG: hypothetical protein LQ348_003525 [Seirophora lacunosa]
MHVQLKDRFAVAQLSSLLAGTTHDNGIFSTRSATGTGGPALRSIQTPGKTSARMVQSKIMKKDAESKGTLVKATMDVSDSLHFHFVPIDSSKAVKSIMAGTATALGQPPVQSTAPPALNLKSAMKSSSSTPKTVAKVVFENNVRMASIIDDSVWSNPEPPDRIKWRGPCKRGPRVVVSTKSRIPRPAKPRPRVVVSTRSRIPRPVKPKLANAGFGLDLAKSMDT